MAPRTSNQRPKILEAAFSVVSSAGAANLTIDAVAERAGVSKGGLLYHFPSKRALLLGMLESMLERYTPLGQAPSLLTEHIEREQTQSAEEAAAGLAIMAAASEDPTLLDPARERIERIFADTKNTYADGELAQLLLLAVEGMRFLKILNLWPAQRNETSALHARLLTLATELAVR